MAWFGREATLYLGSKNWSAWSMRAWLVAHCSQLPFTEIVVPMRITTPGTGVVAEWVSPTKHVPALHLRAPRVPLAGTNAQAAGGAGARGASSGTVMAHPAHADAPVVVHDSLAVIDTTVDAMRWRGGGSGFDDATNGSGYDDVTDGSAYDAAAGSSSRSAQAGLRVLRGPRDPLDRARMRALVCEMHAGYPALRTAMPFNIQRMDAPSPPRRLSGVSAAALDADIRRMVESWRQCQEVTMARRAEARAQPRPSSARGDSGSTGNGGGVGIGGTTDGTHRRPLFLLGDTPTLADLMFAPVATRLVAYGVEMDGDTAGYVRALLCGAGVACGGGVSASSSSSAIPPDSMCGVPGVAEFIAAARQERWHIDVFDV